MNKSNKKLILIDADYICYTCSKDSIEESITAVKEHLQYLAAELNTDNMCLFITPSGKTCFRYGIYPEYKANRKKIISTQLKYIKTIKQYLIDEFQANYHKKYEADDLIYEACMNNFEITDYATIFDIITVSPDKDVLSQCIGPVFNPKKWKLSITTQLDRDNMFLFQLLAGDTADNIKGLPLINEEIKTRFNLTRKGGCGEKSAQLIINELNKIHNNVFLKMYKDIQTLYISAFNNNYDIATQEFNKNYKLLKLGLLPSNKEEENKKIINRFSIIDLNEVLEYKNKITLKQNENDVL